MYPKQTEPGTRLNIATLLRKSTDSHFEKEEVVWLDVAVDDLELPQPPRDAQHLDEEEDGDGLVQRPLGGHGVDHVEQRALLVLRHQSAPVLEGEAPRDRHEPGGRFEMDGLQVGRYYGVGHYD